MKPLLLYLPLFALLFSGCCAKSKQELVACGEDKVFILDFESSTEGQPNIIWSWAASEATDLPDVYRTKYLIPFDECKPVDSSTKILLTSSGGGIVLLDRATKKSLFYAYCPMAHSAEMLPNNRIAVANSTHPEGNSLEIYDIDTPEKVIFKDSLYSGHGVVWMYKHKLLFALGFDDLRAYSLKNWDSDSPELALERKWLIPSEGGHDLTRISDNELIVTAHENSWVFSIADETFSVFEPLANVHNVKSINYNPLTGQLVYTKAETNWWTNNIYCENPEKVLHFPEIKLYKTRLSQ